MRLLPPMRFRFHEDDRATYGDGWTVYDESALLRTPWRELAEIERQIPMKVIPMLALVHEEDTTAKAAAMWVARRLAGDETPFAEFEPLVHLAEWEQAPGDGDPLAPASSPSPSGE